MLKDLKTIFANLNNQTETNEIYMDCPRWFKEVEYNDGDSWKAE